MSAPLTSEQAEIARLRTYLESANANVMEGARLMEEMSAHAATQSARRLRADRENLIGTCCTLFDAIALGIGNTQLEPTLMATDAGRAIKSALQAAWLATQSKPEDLLVEHHALIADLAEALAHPVIAGMLTAWSYQED